MSQKPLNDPETAWKVSSYCSNGTCVGVQIRHSEGVVRVRNTQDSADSAITFSAEEWRAFVAGVRNEEFDI